MFVCVCLVHKGGGKECNRGETRGDDEGGGCLVAAEVEEWRGWLGVDQGQTG